MAKELRHHRWTCRKQARKNSPLNESENKTMKTAHDMADKIISQSGEGKKVHPPRILSLESDTCILEFYRAKLEQAGYEFLGTCDEQEALRLLRTHPIDLFTQNLVGR